MMRKFMEIILLLSILAVTPNQLENSRIINERHKKEELGEYGDSSKVTLASDRTNVLIKLSEDNLDNYKINNYPLRTDFKSYKKNKFNKHNNKFLDKLTIQYDDIYISKYSSYIEFSFEKESKDKLEKTLNELAKHDFVEKIYVQDDYKPVAMLGGGKYYSGTSDTLISSLSGGEGIKIGLLDYGICDKNNANLTSSNITCRDEWYFIESKTEHATLMASIIVGKDGMVPNAQLFSVQLSGNPVSEIDWLIDNDISVCNVSIGDGTGSYSSSSAYLDYASNTYGITFCCATGNGGDDDEYVSNFSLSSNCISVGAGDDYGVASYTSRISPNGEIRPLVIGPDTVVVSNMDQIYYGGTSVATAVCTGGVALIQKNNPDKTYEPHYVRALLMAYCTPYEDLSYQSNGFYSYAGAGRINIQACIDHYSYVATNINSNGIDTTGYYINRIFTMFEGQTWTIAISYPTMVSNDTPVRSTYGLRVFDIDTLEVIDENNITTDSFEIVHVDIDYYRKYSFTTFQTGSKPYADTDEIYFAYRVVDPE